MSKFYRIRYRFPIDNISDEIEKVSLNYWESRHFKCQLIDKKIFGKRGTTLGNLFSYDMTKLICDLQVEFEENSMPGENETIDLRVQTSTNLNVVPQDNTKMGEIIIRFGNKEAINIII